MYTWWTITGTELLKLTRNRSIWLMLLGLPLIIIFILGKVFGGAGGIEPARVAIYMADGGELHSRIEAFWQQEDVRAYAIAEWADSADNVELVVRESDADYGIVIEAGFSERIRQGLPVQWIAYPGRQEEQNLAARTLAAQLASEFNVRYAAARLAESAPAGANQSESNPAGSAATSRGNGEPLVLSASVKENGETNVFGGISAIQYYSVAYLIMFMLFSGMTAGISLLRGREDGTLARLYAIPQPFSRIVFGYIGSALMLAMIQSAVLIAFTSYVYGVDWGGQLGWIALVCLLMACAATGLALIVASFVRSAQTLQTMFSLLAFAMTFLSGGMVVGFGGLLERIGRWTLNHWAATALRRIMNGGTAMGWDIGILAMIAVGLAAIAAIRLRKVVDTHA